MSEKQKRKEKPKGQTTSPFQWIGIILAIILILGFFMTFSIFVGGNGFSQTSTSIQFTNSKINTWIAASATQSEIHATQTVEALTPTPAP
jgi:hypothetical protein